MNVDPAAILALISTLTAQNAQLAQQNAELQMAAPLSTRVVEDVVDDAQFLVFRSSEGSLILALDYDGTVIHGPAFTSEALRQVASRSKAATPS